MKKTFMLIIMAALAFTVVAQTPAQMLDKAVAALKSGGAMSATYVARSSQGTQQGSIILNGDKYRLTSPELKCWYDGTTLWTYSELTGEVNITTPTAADLQMTNPYAAAGDFKANYHMWKAAGQIPGAYAIMLQPKKKSNIHKVYLYITNGTNLLQQIHVRLTDGTSYTVSLSNYKKGIKTTASTFTFDKTMVPAGTSVVDLR